MAFTRHKVTQMNLGGRYNFTVYGRKSSLRVQIQNILATNEWTSQYTPGFFQWPAPRTVFAYITTDLQ
jgi:iron complex outermembrane recepter protein